LAIRVRPNNPFVRAYEELWLTLKAVLRAGSTHSSLTQSIDAGQRASEDQESVEGLLVNYTVEVRYTGVDWADLMADMRSWLDRRQIKVESLAIPCSVVASPYVSAFTTRITPRHSRLRFRGGCSPPRLTGPQCGER
jgi:hypothetical protein